MKDKSFLKVATTDPFAMMCGVIGAVVGGIIGMIFGGPIGGVLGGVFGFSFLLGGAGVSYVQHKRDLKAYRSLITEVRSRCETDDGATVIPLLEGVHRSGLPDRVKKDVYEAARARLLTRATADDIDTSRALKLIPKMEDIPVKPKGGLIASLTGRHSARGLIPGILKSVRESAGGEEALPAGVKLQGRQPVNPSTDQLQLTQPQPQPQPQPQWRGLMEGSDLVSGPGRSTRASNPFGSVTPPG